MIIESPLDLIFRDLFYLATMPVALPGQNVAALKRRKVEVYWEA